MNTVTHLSSVHYRYDTRIFYKQCRSLAAQGYAVNLVVADGRGNEIKEGVNIIDVAKSNSSRVSKILNSTFYIIKTRPFLVHIHDPELIPSALIFKIFGISVIFDMHEYFPKQILNKRWIPRWARGPLSSIWTLIERVTLPFFPVIMAESSYVKHYPWIKRKVVVQNYPDADIVLHKSKKFDVFTVGYIGGVTKERGAIIVASAIGALRDKDVAVNFHCLGPISSEVLENEHFKRGIDEGWLHAPGRVNGSEGWATIARCHVGVAVLAPIPNYVESWPTKVFEYMSMSIPVIVSNFPLYQQLIVSEKCGLYVDPNNVSEISAAIKFMIDDPETASAMGDRGLIAVRSNYSWHNEFANLRSIYKLIHK